MKVIGYGICGPGEAGRYMKATLDEFKRLCDEVFILCNNTDRAEEDLIDSYGFHRVRDRRSWGQFQWRIKQDFLERNVSQIAQKGDMVVCLDMDEVLDSRLTKEWLLEAPLDAYHVFVVDLWGEGYKPESCFWNVRIFRWNGETKFKAKPVHCGLAPEWTYFYHRFAPFLLLHYGLMKTEDRLRRVDRYKKYDPKAEYLDKRYYDMLNDERFKPFDEQALHDKIAKEVATYKQTKPRENMAEAKKKPRFAYVRHLVHGHTVDIPEAHLEQTLKRGFEFIGWADDRDKEMSELFGDVEVDTREDGVEHLADASMGSYQRPQADEARELAGLNNPTPTEPVSQETTMFDADDHTTTEATVVENDTSKKEEKTDVSKSIPKKKQTNKKPNAKRTSKK